jgi:AcrR family transcriptional regulator
MSSSDKKEKKREQIFEAAVGCFVDSGYDETKLESIAQKAGISKGGLFHYFKSKKELFLALFAYKVNQYHEQIKTCVNPADTPEDQLRTLVQKAVDFLKINQDFYKFSLEFLSMGVRDPEIRKVMSEFYKNSLATFYGIIEQGVHQGRFEKGLDIEKTARAFYLLVMGLFFTYFSTDVDFDILQQQNFQIDRIIKGIKK